MSILVICALSPLAMAQDPTQVRAAFEQAVDKNDFSTQRNIVSELKDQCVTVAQNWEFDYCKARMAANDDQAAKLLAYMDAMGNNYSIVQKSGLILDRKAFVSGLTNENIAKRLEAIRFYYEGYGHFDEGKKSGDEMSLNEANNQFADSYNSSVEIEDWLSAGWAADRISDIFVARKLDFETIYWARMALHQANKTKYANLFTHLDARIVDYEKKEKVRRPDLIDLTLPIDEAKAAHAIAFEESLKVKPLPGGDGGVLVPPSSKIAYTWEDFDGFKSKKLPLWSKVFLPWYRPDVTPVNPRELVFRREVLVVKDAEATKVPMLPGATWTYDGKLEIDLDGESGKARPKPIKLKLKPGLQKFDVTYQDDSKGTVNLLMQERPGNYKVLGNGVRDPDASKHIIVAFQGATAMEGKVHGQTLTLIDTDGNGAFNDTGEDSVIIGSGSNQRIEPLGRYIYLEEEGGLFPYDLKIIKDNGSAVRVRPYQGDLAPVMLEYSSPTGKMPDYLIARGSGEDIEFYFDLMKAIDKPLWVPSGQFKIHRGMFILDSKGEETILIGPGRAPPFKVETGRMNIWQLGGAGEQGFWMLGKASRSGTEAKVLGKDIEVFGNGGEQYFNFVGELLVVDAEIRKDGPEGSRVGKETMKPYKGGDPQRSVDDMFWPDNATFDKLPKSGKLVIQFSAKHGVLGQIQSDWIEIL
ncbi:MAG: hypothetical protein KDB53_18570 [Planctomycetes bacterium]|nr:hypothetical protein [Planctomycetota bacterium]